MFKSVYLTCVCLSAAGVAFGGNAFGAAIASAEPNDVVWDIEAYDDCMNKAVHDADQCCVDSGGVPAGELVDGGRGQKCQAPPAQAEASGRTLVRPG